MTDIVTDLATIEEIARENENENDHFYSFIKHREQDNTDEIVHRLNAAVSGQIDCTQCGNCCRSLMINVEPVESEILAEKLKMDADEFKKEFIEESAGGKLIINTIPCHFLVNNRCTIYENRFTECREFPHLHKPNFSRRLSATLMYYSMCPIIFNVVEKLKIELGFKIVVP